MGGGGGGGVSCFLSLSLSQDSVRRRQATAARRGIIVDGVVIPARRVYLSNSRFTWPSSRRRAVRSFPRCARAATDLAVFSRRRNRFGPGPRRGRGSPEK